MDSRLIPYTPFQNGKKLVKVFITAATLSNLSGLTQILISQRITFGIDPVLFISLDSMIVSFTARIALLPVVMLATASSVNGLEGFSFAALISIYDSASVFSGLLSTSIVSTSHLT
jgi:hypothetical protein